MKDNELRTLVSQAQAGDRDALARLLEVFVPLRETMTNKNHVLGAEHDDVGQQASMIIILAILGYDLSKSGSPFFHITVKAQSDMKNFSVKENVEFTKAIPSGHMTEDDGSSTDDYTEQIAMNDLLGQLPANDREALEAKFYDGLTEEEIAKHLGVTRGAVDNMISRSLKHLRAALSEDAE